MFQDFVTFIEDNYRLVETAAVGLAAVLGVIWLWSRWKRRPLVRRAGPLARFRSTRAADQDPEKSRELAQMLRYQAGYDALGRWRVRRAVEGRQAQIDLVDGRIGHYNLAIASAGPQLAAFCESLPGAKDEPVAIHNRWVLLALNGCLLAGDVLIVSTALSAAEGSLTSQMSLVATIAIAVSLWGGGKLIGDGILDIAPKKADEYVYGGAKILLGVMLAVGTAYGLASLREAEVFVTWLLLSLAPALGSTAITLLSSSRSYKVLRAAESRWDIKWWLLSHHTKRMAKAQSKLDRLDARVNLELARAQLDELAIGTHGGIVPTTERLTDSITNSSEIEEQLLMPSGTRDRILPRTDPAGQLESGPMRRNRRTSDVLDRAGGHVVADLRQDEDLE